MPQQFDRYSFLVERDVVVVVVAAAVAGVVEDFEVVELEFQHRYHNQHLIEELRKKSIM